MQIMKSEIKRKMKKWTIMDTVAWIIATVMGASCLYPMIYVFSCSISDPYMVSAGLVKLLPVGFSSKAYEIVMADQVFWRSLFNSVIYVISNCVLMLLTTIVVAYPLTRPNLKFRKVLTYYLLVPMFVGGGMIPSFLVITKLGLYNSPLALILPGSVGIWNIILCRTFMKSLPEELVDAAMIDGCNQIQIIGKIVTPLSKPVLAVIMIYTIVGVWNSWFNASIYTTHKEIQPVQLYLKNIMYAAGIATSEEMLLGLPEEEVMALLEYSLSANQIKYTVIVLVTIPIIAVYPMFQKHFTKGVMLGSLKG